MKSRFILLSTIKTLRNKTKFQREKSTCRKRLSTTSKSVSNYLDFQFCPKYDTGCPNKFLKKTLKIRESLFTFFLAKQY